MLLEGRNIGFQYKKNIWTLHGVNVSIKSGESVGLIGPSGCGKTTLARIMAGYITPHEGSVLIDNCKISSTGYSPVQLVFQHPEKAVNPRWTMNKILNEGWNPDKEILKKLEIKTEWLSRWPNELSGGELQRFCIARALGPKTKFLIADEMTTMLDAITQAQIWKAVIDIIKKRDMGLVVVSHDRYLIDRICSRVIDFKKWGT